MALLVCMGWRVLCVGGVGFCVLTSAVQLWLGSVCVCVCVCPHMHGQDAAVCVCVRVCVLTCMARMLQCVCVCVCVFTGVILTLLCAGHSVCVCRKSHAQGTAGDHAGRPTVTKPPGVAHQHLYITYPH